MYLSYVGRCSPPGGMDCCAVCFWRWAHPSCSSLLTLHYSLLHPRRADER